MAEWKFGEIPAQIVVSEHHGVPVLALRGVCTAKLHDVSFDLARGEILGFYGLIGSGKTEIARAIFGLDAKDGVVEIDGAPVSLESPRDAIARGIALVPEERRSEGLFSKLSIRENIPLMNIRSISRYGIWSARKERQLARSFMGKVRIVARDESHIVEKLSGGNQQKVVLSKCINAESRVLLMDEPTRGIDVGAKEEIHKLIRELARTGTAVIVCGRRVCRVLQCQRSVYYYKSKRDEQAALRKRIKEIVANGASVDSERIMHVVTGAGGA